jgi:hypothetical protein
VSLTLGMDSRCVFIMPDSFIHHSSLLVTMFFLLQVSQHPLTTFLLFITHSDCSPLSEMAFKNLFFVCWNFVPHSNSTVFFFYSSYCQVLFFSGFSLYGTMFLFLFSVSTWSIFVFNTVSLSQNLSDTEYYALSVQWYHNHWDVFRLLWFMYVCTYGSLYDSQHLHVIVYPSWQACKTCGFTLLLSAWHARRMGRPQKTYQIEDWRPLCAMNSSLVCNRAQLLEFYQRQFSMCLYSIQVAAWSWAQTMTCRSMHTSFLFVKSF